MQQWKIEAAKWRIKKCGRPSFKKLFEHFNKLIDVIEGRKDGSAR